MANERYHAAVAREEHNRLRALFPRQLPLLLARRFGTAPALFPLVTLTWRHVLELTEWENAFFKARIAPFRGDFVEVLWRLHPFYRSPEGVFSNLAADCRAPSRLVSLIAYLLVIWQCRRLDLPAAEYALRERLQEAWQDEPGPPLRKKGQAAPITSILAPRLNRFDEVCAYFAARGWPLDRTLAAGVAWTMQVYRAHLIQMGEGERCDPPSAALIEFEPEDNAAAPAAESEAPR